MAGTGPGHITAPAAALADQLPGWVALVRAPNPGPLTLDGTNTWVLRVAPDVPAVVVDPGPLDEGHLRTVAGLGPVGTVLATHRHPDHVEGLNRLVALTGARVITDVEDLEEADQSGWGGLALRRIATPGHTGDSVCYEAAVREERVLLTGDTILGRGTTVVAWPDGDLGHYMDSLRLLTGYGGVPVLPGHGPALADCAVAARFYLAHRHARLDQVRAAVAAGADTAAEVVDRVYSDVDPALRDAAHWSVRAQLTYLAMDSASGATRLDRP